MKIAVRYYTRSGNTKKLAKAVAETLSVEAKEVTEPLAEKVDVLFLGCSYYAFDVDPSVKEFIEKNKDSIGKIVCFGTSAMMKSMIKPVSKVAKAVGVEVCKDEFHCRGEFSRFHNGRPNAEDIENIRKFAKEIIKI